MEYIEFEKEFKAFMEKEGKVTEAIKDYMSRLRFIAKNGFYIGRGMLDIDTIIDSLKKTESNRKTYKNSKQYSNLKSALKKYKYFITAKENNLVDDIEAIRKDRTISETQKELLTFARIGQGKYRKDLIGLWGKCSVSECNMTDLLIASHIKPWSESSNKEKLDSYNGLLLLPNYDKLFDKHLISFDDDGKIIISSQIKEEEYKVLGISANDKLFNVFEENKPYLKIHREIFYKKNYFKC
jgi:hypothetical protein